jgi:hypothetical protein
MHAIVKYRNGVQICGTQSHDWDLGGRMKWIHVTPLNPSHDYGIVPVRVADAELATRHAMGTILHARDRCDVNVDGLTMFCIAIPRLLRRLSATRAWSWSLEAHTRPTCTTRLCHWSGGYSMDASGVQAQNSGHVLT